MAFGRLQAGRNLVQKTGLDKLFGNGADGTVVIASNTHLSRDMYYENLTVNSEVTLFTNGFRVFVKNNLINNGTLGMPSGISQTTAVMTGTVATRDDGTGGYQAGDALDSGITIANVKDFDSLITGVLQGSGTLRRYFPGAVGTSGADGADGAAGTANAGGASGGGNATAGNAGTAGTQGSKGTGGAGGKSGGTVLVVAKNISGSGVFVSESRSGSAGTAGTSGNPGASGNAGNPAPGNPHPGNPHPGNPNPGNPHPGNPGHNPDVVNVNAHHTPQQHHQVSNPNHQHPHNHGASHTAAHHKAAQANFNPQHKSAFNFAGHHTHKGHTHGANRAAAHNPATHGPGTPFHNPGGHNPAGSNPGGHNPGGHNPDGVNPSFGGGAAGTGNPGTAGNPGASGNSGAAGVLSILTRSINTHVGSANTTIVEDLDD